MSISLPTVSLRDITVGLISLCVVLSTSSLAETPKLQVMVTRETSDGYTQDDLNTTVMQAVEKWFLERVQFHTAQRVQKPKAIEAAQKYIRAESVLLESNGNKAIFTNIFVGDFVSSVMFAGIVGPDFVRITCIGQPFMNVEVVGTECGKTASKVLKIGLPNG